MRESAGTGKCTQTGQCFIAGTLVLTVAGLKSIEEIEVGDEVLAYDEESGEQAYKPVVRLFHNETKAWYHVKVNGEEIICTGGHPFYVLNAEEDRNIVNFEGVKASGVGKWICARELKVSDQVLLSDGSCAIIEEIEIETLSTLETTYNFEVADFHTYYVSDNKVLVHNDCPANKKALVELIKENGKSKPMSMNDAETLVQWGKEYGLNIRIDMGHTTGSLVSRSPHLHTGFNSWHIPIIMK